MGRPIKFRTWDTQNKEFSEWTNRDPFFSTSHSQIFFWERVRKEDGSFDGDIIIQDHGGRFVLQQFTGLLDKNNKEIYEGDIVTYQAGEPNKNDGSFYRSKSVVEFENGAFWPRPIKEECEDSWYDYELKDLEVIGNIFENPELA